MKISLAKAALAVLSLGAVQPAQAATDGRKVYESICAACHATGIGNAPKLGDRAAWAPRVPAGRDGLVRSVIAGKGAMPTRAGNPKLADADIRAAVDYMLSSVR